MSGFARTCALVVAVGLLCAGLQGCFRTREEVYSGLRTARRRAYTRWREDTEEDLPVLEGPLGLRDAVTVALAFNNDLRRTIQQKAKARGRVVEAYGEALPSLDASAGYTRLDEIMTIDLGVATFDVGDKNNWFYQLELTQPLFKGGSIPAAVRGAQLFRYISDESVRQAVQEVVTASARGYYDVLLADHLHQVQQAALKFAEANLRNVKARRKEGLAVRYDVLRAQLEVSITRADLIRRRNRLSRARTRLFHAMGVSQRSEVDLSGELTYAPMEADYEDAVETAFMHRPELYSAELDVGLQQEGLRALRSDYWPRLEAWAWHRWAKPDPHEATNIEWDRQWQAGLRLTWNVFDGLRREGGIIQQKAVVRQSIIELASREQQVLEEVRNAVLDLEDAREMVESQRLNLEQANEALRLVTVGAREGLNTELEVLDARSALSRARGLYYEALHAHAVARVAYQRAVGLLGPAPGREEVPEEVPVLWAEKTPEQPED